MKVALDAQLTLGTATGIGEYVRGLSEALRRRSLDLIELSDAALDPWRFDRRIVWDQLVLPRRARACGAELLHCAAGTMPRNVGVPVVVTVHDLAWHHAQAHAPWYARYYFGAFSLRRYRQAATLVVDSEFTRAELLGLLPEFDEARVHVVYPGVSAEFGDLVRVEGDRRTILAVGTVERRKNLEVLIRALPHLPNCRLVCCGPLTPYANECAALARRLDVADRVELCGYIPRARLLELYARCAVAAVPSTYEGFGYAVAQALCAGVPCVVAATSSLPEVAGGAAAIVDPHDPIAWAQALAAAVAGGDDARAASARADAVARFSWERSAAFVERAYESSVNR